MYIHGKGGWAGPGGPSTGKENLAGPFGAGSFGGWFDHQRTTGSSTYFFAIIRQSFLKSALYLG
jgi:hypothetical protein